MRAARLIGNTMLWLVALAGVLAGGLWGANAAGLIQPLIVVSGSMEPGIMTGDLVFSTPLDASELAVGDVATLPSTLTGRLVTHRVIDIAAGQQAGRLLVHMQGDANVFADSEEYVVSGPVWTPFARVAGGGYALAAVSKPGVVIPLALTLLALIALSTLPRREDEKHDADAGEADSGVRAAVDTNSVGHPADAFAGAPA